MQWGAISQIDLDAQTGDAGRLQAPFRSGLADSRQRQSLRPAFPVCRQRGRRAVQLFPRADVV